jgi:SAM-dependent methyltransferase
MTAHLPASPPAFADAAATWNGRFTAAGDAFLFGTAPNDWLAGHAGAWAPGARVLCVADGEGRNSVWLAQRGVQVEAFDIAAAGVAKARALAARHGVTVDFTVADCDAFPWPQRRYDGVAAIFIQFADPAQRARLFARIVDSLAPGGTLVLQGYTVEQMQYRSGGPGKRDHLYTPELLREAFAALEIVELRTYEAELAEGTAHVGRAALVGLVARRT